MEKEDLKFGKSYLMSYSILVHDFFKKKMIILKSEKEREWWGEPMYLLTSQMPTTGMKPDMDSAQLSHMGVRNPAT